MKTLIRSVLAAMLFGVFLIPAQGQTRMLWDDQQDLISNSGETLLMEKLADDDIEIVMTLDYKKRCEYSYAELTGGLNKATLTIYDCNRKVLGTKSWLSKFFSIPEEERIALLAFAIIEMMENPIPAKVVGGQQPVEDVRFTDDQFTVPFNHHTTRYFFSPSSYNLKRGELYYNTLYFASHDLQYGIVDKFSIGMGTTVALMPFYVTPKFSHQISEKHAVSIGSLFFIGTWGVDFFGNLGYATYTYGNQFNNITLGVGHLYAGGEDVDNSLNQVLVNLSGMARMSDYIYFVSENYFLGFDESATGYYSAAGDPWPWQYDYLENIPMRNNLVAGMTGFRFINKSRNVSAFQFGLTYVVKMRDALDPKYKSDNWYVDYSTGDWKRFVIPTISFVSKLGKRV